MWPLVSLLWRSSVWCTYNHSCPKAILTVQYLTIIQYPNAAHIPCSPSFEADTNSLSQISNHVSLHMYVWYVSSNWQLKDVLTDGRSSISSNWSMSSPGVGQLFYMWLSLKTYLVWSVDPAYCPNSNDRDQVRNFGMVLCQVNWSPQTVSINNDIILVNNDIMAPQ